MLYAETSPPQQQKNKPQQTKHKTNQQTQKPLSGPVLGSQRRAVRHVPPCAPSRLMCHHLSHPVLPACRGPLGDLCADTTVEETHVGKRTAAQWGRVGSPVVRAVTTPVPTLPAPIPALPPGFASSTLSHDCNHILCSLPHWLLNNMHLRLLHSFHSPTIPFSPVLSNSIVRMDPLHPFSHSQACWRLPALL